MRHLLPLLVIVSLSTSHLFAQAKTRKLPNNINHPSINVSAPFMSADANALVFLSDNSEDNLLTMFYTFKENADWRDPIVAPKQVNTRANYLRGFGLSADGKKLYFTSTKSPIVGGYDIFASDFKGSGWGEPQNLGAPINTKSNEGSPSFTPDGNAIYFMRCDKMDQTSASGCKIFVDKKKSNGQWDEPAELPAAINTGNSQAPRIMADGETLIFSSDKMTGKGGMDLYVTRFRNGNWTTPVAMDFVNTDKDDEFISVNALGRYLLRDSPGARKNELVEYLIPNDLRPRGMMKVDGKVTDPSGAVTPAYVSIVDLNSNKRVYNGRPAANGSFLVYLMEGSKYELSIDPEQSNITYYAKQFDLTSDKIPQGEKVNAILKPVAAGDELSLEGVQFKSKSNELDAASSSDLKRLARIIKASPQLKFEIQVMLKGYAEDSIQSNADFTEVVIDSIKMQQNGIDSLGQLYKNDYIKVKTTYHNDRTAKQASAIVNYLVSQGADANSLTTLVNAIPSLPENKKTTVKATARAK